MDYQKGKIYKIVSFQTALIYVGSTCQSLSKRMSIHMSAYKTHLAGKGKRLINSFEILKYGAAEIVLIEAFPCKSKEELYARERHFIETLDCVNKVIPTRTKKEYDEMNYEMVIRKGNK